MAVIRTLLIILEAACSLALIGLILLQKSKSDGLGAAFGGGGNDSLLGARAGNVLTKATVGIGLLFLVNTLVLGLLYAGSASESLMDRADAPAAAPVAVEQPIAVDPSVESIPAAAQPIPGEEAQVPAEPAAVPAAEPAE